MRFKKFNNIIIQVKNGCHCYQKRCMASSSLEGRPFESIPGLKSLPVIGPLHHFLPIIGEIGPKANLFEMVSSLHEKYGPVVKMDGIYSRGTFVILFEPEHFDQVYRAEEANPLRPGFETFVYYREELRKSVYDGCYGLTTAQGDKWRDFRTKVNPAMLKPKLVKLYTPGLIEIANDMTARLMKLSKEPNYLKNNFDAEVAKWSLESVALVGLGTRIGSLQDDLGEEHPAKKLMNCTKDVVNVAFKLEFFPIPWRYLPASSFNKLINILDTQWEISASYINQARKQINERGHDVPEEDKSIIEKLLAIDERVAIMMANEMLFAGIDTVAFAVTGLLYHLASNPKVQDKLREEIRSEESGNRYLRACLKESLRIWHVIPANLRRTGKSHFVAGYHIPKGVDVIAPNEYLSRLEKYYPRPTEYIPERWIVDKSDPLYYGNAHPMVTLPFGFGVRSCIGRRIAELEIEILMKTLLNKVKVGWEGPPLKVVSKLMNSFKKPYYFTFENAK